MQLLVRPFLSFYVSYSSVKQFMIPEITLLTYSMVQSPSWEANWFCSQSRHSPHFMEPESSSPYSQVSAICPYPEPTPSSLYPSHFPNIHLNIILPSTSGSGSSQWSLPQVSPLELCAHLSPPPYAPHIRRLYVIHETFLCVLKRNENNENVKSTEVLWIIQPVFLLETSKYGIRNLQKFVHGNLCSFRSDIHQTYTKLEQKKISPNNDSSYKNPSMQHVQNSSICCRYV